MSDALKILVVDDDPDIIEQLTFLLKAEGYQVAAAGGLEEAEQVLLTICPDLAIVDLMMEHKDSGFVLCHEIKKLYPGQTKEDTRAKIDLLEELFGSNSWTEISTYFSNEKLAEGLNNLQLKSLKVEDDIAKAEAAATPAPAPTNGKSKTKGAHA